MALTKVKSLTTQHAFYEPVTWSFGTTYDLNKGNNFFHANTPTGAWDAALTNVPTSIDDASAYVVKVKIIYYMSNVGYYPSTVTVNGTGVTLTTLSSNLVVNQWATSEITLLRYGGSWTAAHLFNSRLGAI